MPRSGKGPGGCTHRVNNGVVNALSLPRTRVRVSTLGGAVVFGNGDASPSTSARGAVNNGTLAGERRFGR